MNWTGQEMALWRLCMPVGHYNRAPKGIEVRDSWTGYLVPVRDGPGALPDLESSWDVAAAATAAAAVAAAVAARPPPPPGHPKYKFRHPKYSGISSDTQSISSDTQSTAVFPGSIPNQNDGISSIPRFNTKSKWRVFQYSQVQYQIKMTGFSVFPGSIPNQNDGIFSIPRFKTKSSRRDVHIK